MKDTQPLRGVNLGGWLVLERWLTPSLFKGVDARDEWSFMRTPGARDKLVRHRKEFIQEEDFAWLQANGVTAVRIPVGYWLFEDRDGYMACLAELEWAVQMAETYGLKVLIDLHAAPGSQNGLEHSGRRGPVQWHGSAEFQERTIRVLEQIAAHFYDSPAVWGIELLNEPKSGFMQWRLRRFYRRAYKRVAKVARPGVALVFHDAFTPLIMAGALRGTREHPVVLDVHWYQPGDALAKKLPLGWYFWRLRRRAWVVRYLQLWQPIVVGEWGMALNGEVMRRYDKAREWEYFDEHRRLQLAAYEQTAGWFYWNYKADGRGIWNFRSLVEDGRLTVPR